MRKSTVLAAAAALAIAGGSAGVLVAHAAPPPPPPPGPAGGPGFGPHGHGGWHHRWAHRGPEGWRHHRLVAPGTFALLYHPANREITVADAQDIATGFLRWNGNHSWKVVDVKQLSDNDIGFAYATADNSVIARFTINSRTGQIRRVG
ncbi:MAG: hypothetical protein KGL52_00550 [Rhodospirillales bacterium]|jgi:hypothetical protein|nr:hypothetical protein [Rhodospirillales bacterium]